MLGEADTFWCPDSSVGKESACNAGDPGLIPGSGRSTGEGIGYPVQYSWVSLMAQLVKNLPAMRGPGFDPWVGKIPWRRERLPTPVFWPGEFHGLYNPWGHKESDTTEWLSLGARCLRSRCGQGRALPCLPTSSSFWLPRHPRHRPDLCLCPHMTSDPESDLPSSVPCKDSCH